MRSKAVVTEQVSCMLALPTGLWHFRVAFHACKSARHLNELIARCAARASGRAAQQGRCCNLAASACCGVAGCGAENALRVPRNAFSCSAQLAGRNPTSMPYE